MLAAPNAPTDTAGLLIVNADDWGASSLTTDRIGACFEAGSIFSASAMVYMADSERAASLAQERQLPVGLHLNLTQEFTGAKVPTAVRDRQSRLVRRLASPRRRRYDPGLGQEVARAVADQLDRFRETYVGDPTHLDGHNHIHLNPAVLVAIPRATKIRTAHTPSPSAGNVARLMRRCRQTALERWFSTTEFFFAVEKIHPALGGSGLEQVLSLSRRASVEIMTHPSRDAEYALLLSQRWHQTLAGCPTGSFAQLAGGPRGRRPGGESARPDGDTPAPECA